MSLLEQFELKLSIHVLLLFFIAISCLFQLAIMNSSVNNELVVFALTVSE